MRMIRTLTCLSVLLFVVGGGDSPAGENSSLAGAGKHGGESSNKQSAAERLAGTYVSDRAAAIAFWESTGQYNADKLKSLGSSSGKSELTYQGSTRTTIIDGEVSTHEFAIVDSDPNHVTIAAQWSAEEQAPMGEDSDIERIEFTHDSLWLGKAQSSMDRSEETFVRK